MPFPRTSDYDTSSHNSDTQISTHSDSQYSQLSDSEPDQGQRTPTIKTSDSEKDGDHMSRRRTRSSERNIQKVAHANRKASADPRISSLKISIDPNAGLGKLKPASKPASKKKMEKTSPVLTRRKKAQKQ